MDMFSLVAKMSTVRALLTLAKSNDWFLHQMDVNNAFFHGDLSEEIFMNPPKGYDVLKGKVLRFTKSLYGFK